MSRNMEQEASEMSEKLSEKSEMSTVDFVQSALRKEIAPAAIGGVEARIRHAARRLGWSFTRTKDAWYADPRISINGKELRAIEDESGLRYGREELSEIDSLIASADALLAGENPDQHRPFLAAMRTILSALDRAGTQR